MAKIKSLHIHKFRGIKDLKVDFNKKSWVIHGRNGSGKSGVIDGIEFGLSGVIGRLTGEGRGDVSVKDHGPHVDSKLNPKDSVVTIVIEFSTGEELTIIRNCANPTKPKLLPSGELGKKLYNKLYFGKEVVLSRRDILKFVLTEPGKRSKEVQSLLKIEKLEEIRSAFQTLCNKVSKKSSNAQTNMTNNKEKLASWLKIPELTKEKFLDVVNESRKSLKLPVFTELKADTCLNDGVALAANESAFYSKKDLLEAISDIKQKILDSDKKYLNSFNKYIALITELEEKSNIEKEIKRLSFLEKGLPLVESDECPLCEKSWSAEVLKKQISEKIEELSNIKTTIGAIEAEISVMAQVWKDIDRLINIYKTKSDKENKLKIDVFDNFKESIVSLLDSDNKSLNRYKTLEKNKELCGFSISLDSFNDAIQKGTDAVNALPEKSDDDKAKEFLAVCQERLENYRSSKKEYEFHNEKLSVISLSLENYNQITETYLNDLYNDIESDFSRYYQIVNEDDEASFTGNLTAEEGALDFKVEFYGRGKFPPAAYHSEGHQDGMGLCLYLALMKKILGDDFSIAILDDVLMSVDSAHRKHFCKLLKTEFKNTQFVITTHDQYWQKQMITEGLVTHASSLKFKNWSVDTGPSVWSDKESWELIDSYLGEENVPEASSELRRFLEYYSDEVAIRIGAKVLKNVSGDHGLGELLVAISSRYSELLKKAKKSAKSWGKDEVEKQYESEKEDFSSLLKDAQSELWSINATVHFNKWAEMDVKDFSKVKETFKKFTDIYKCADCNTLIHVVPTIGSSESLKCDCGTRSYNLKVKSS